MPLQQKTFTLVPNAPQFFNGPPTRSSSKPPMTTKQARKLYNQQTRVPRRTKAEQRAWERAEQERIRQELEKDKAANKAKAVRERKKAKEKAELEEKRRLGLPTAKVRPSQDTISRFLRSFGAGVGQKSRETTAEAKTEAEVEVEAEGDAEAETKAEGASDRESRSPRAGKRRRLNPLEPELQAPPKPPSSVAVPSVYDCLPPTSTQAFLLNNIDDIFPTPSQEARELFGDENRLPPLAKPARPPPSKPVYPPPPPQPPSSRSKFLQPSRASTGPSDARGIPPRRFLRAATQRNDLVHRSAPPLPKRAMPPHPSPVSGIPFFSTQDVILSSQDIREVEEKPSSSRTVACPVRPTPRRVLEEIQCDYGAMSGISSTQETFYGDLDLGEAIALLEGESQ